MKIEVDGLGEIDVPDNLNDEQIGLYIDAYAAGGGKKQSPSGRNMKQFLSKAMDFVKGGKKRVDTALRGVDQGASSVLTDLLTPVMTDEALESARARESQAQMEAPGFFKAGQIGADVAATALPATKGAKLAGKLPQAASVLGKAARAAGVGLGAGVGSAATHGALDATSGRGVDPGDFLAEIVFSGGLGAAGNLAGQGLKAGAPAVLENLAKPRGALLDSKNPPTREGFELALERDLIPGWGGFGKAAEKTGKYLGDRSAQREGVLNATGKAVSVKTMISNSKRNLTNLMKDGTQGVTPADREAALKWFDDAEEYAKTLRSYNPKTGEISLADAVRLKSSIMKNAKPVMAESQEGRKLASEQVGKGARNIVSKAMRGDVREDIFKEMEGQMRLLSPVQEALDAKKGSIPLWETITGVGSLGVGGGLAGSGNLAGGALAAGLPLAALGMRHTPAPAALMYKGGQGLLAPSANRSLAAQAARSGIFGGP